MYFGRIHWRLIEQLNRLRKRKIGIARAQGRKRREPGGAIKRHAIFNKHSRGLRRLQLRRIAPVRQKCRFSGSRMIYPGDAGNLDGWIAFQSTVKFLCKFLEFHGRFASAKCESRTALRGKYRSRIHWHRASLRWRGLAGHSRRLQVCNSLLTYTPDAPSIQWGSDGCRREECLEKNELDVPCEFLCRLNAGDLRFHSGVRPVRFCSEGEGACARFLEYENPHPGHPVHQVCPRKWPDRPGSRGPQGPHRSGEHLVPRGLEEREAGENRLCPPV